MSEPTSLIEELRRRNVIKVVTAYAVAGFIILQLCDIIFPALGIADEVIGYVLIALVILLPFVVAFTWMFEITPDGLRRSHDVERDESISHFTGQRINYLIIFLLSVALGFFVWQYLSRPSETPETIEADALPIERHEGVIAEAPSENMDTRPSIAVLPFVNMSSDKENEYFSDGLSEEILNLLAQSPELRVAGRTSSFFFKNKNEDLREIGQTLDVAHILEGSVRKSGNKVRITAQLINADDGFHLWSKTYDRELIDIFAVQDEIAGAVTRAMEVTLLTDGIVVSDRSTTNPETYDLYLRAKNALYERELASVIRSVDLFKQSLVLDAEYAPAYVDLAVAELLLNWNYGIRSVEEAEANASIALAKAKDLGHLTSDCYAVLGLYHANLAPIEDSHFPKAVAAYEKAIDLNPNNVRAYMWWATLISTNKTSLADLKRALELNKQARKLDPLNRVANGNHAGLLMAAGRYDEALKDIQRLVRIDPDYHTYRTVLTNIYLNKFELVKATESLVESPNHLGSYPFMLMTIFSAFDDMESFFNALDTVPVENPSFELIELVENARNATVSELRAEAEVLLLKPDPNFFSTAVIFNLMLVDEYDLVRRLIENARVDMAKPEPSTARANNYDPRWPYLTAIYKLGQTERARRYAEALLLETQDLSATGVYSRGTIHAICYLVLDEQEKALAELELLQREGWLGYYQEIDKNPIWDELIEHPRVQSVKQKIDVELDKQRPTVYKILKENGLVSSI